MKDETNKIINWIEMGYTRLNYKEELSLVDYIKQLQKENKELKEKNEFLKSEIEEAKRITDSIIKNTYKTLMTRGMKGCYVYCTDKKLNEYLKNR